MSFIVRLNYKCDEAGDLKCAIDAIKTTVIHNQIKWMIAIINIRTTFKIAKTHTILDTTLNLNLVVF